MEPFKFTKTLFTEIIPSVGKSFLDSAKEKGGEFVAAEPKERAEMLADAQEGLAKEIVAGTATFGKSVLELVYGKEAAKTTEGEKSFYGREIPTLQEMHRRSNTFVGDLGGSPSEQVVYPVLGTLGYAFLESPIGAPGKSVKLSRTLLKDIAETTNEKKIKTLLLNNIPGIKETTAARQAKKLIDARTENAVLQTLSKKYTLIKDETSEIFDGKNTTIGELDTLANRLDESRDKLIGDKAGPPKTVSTFDDTSFGHNITKQALDNSVKEPPSLFDKTNKTYLDGYPGWRDTTSQMYLNSREFLQDNWIRQKQLSKDLNIDLIDVTNPYLRETLFYGRIGGRLESTRELLEDQAKTINTLSKEVGDSVENINKNLNDFLYSRHAIERNERLGDGAAGISTEAAKKRLKDLEDAPYKRQLDELSENIMDIHNESLTMLREAGVLDDVTYQTLKKTYPNHVPLYRKLEGEEEAITDAFFRSFDVGSTGIKRAKGSEKEVDDILGNIVWAYEQAAVRAEKNVVDLATLNFARQNKNLTVGNTKTPLFEEITPKAIGKTFDGKIIKEPLNDPRILKLFEDGKPVYLRINDEPLAKMYRNINTEKVPGFIKITGMISRFYGGLQTRFNPSFALPNKIRDIQEALAYIDAETKGSVRARDLTKYALRAEKGVIDAIRGADTEMANLYKQMVKDGGTTGGLGLSTRKDINLNWKKTLRNQSSQPRKVALDIVRQVDNFNKVFEDSTRLAVYAASLDRGFSRDQAAFFAKNASVNFNKKGTAGPIINALYVFSNASIQGAAKSLRAMKNPKTAAKIIGTIGAGIYAVNQYNDRLDPDWRQKVTKWDRMNGFNIVIQTDEGFNYVSIPLAWSFKPIKVMMDSAYDLSEGNISLTQASEDTMVSIMEAYNPVGGTDLMSAVTPTFLGPIPTDLLLDLSRNRAWHGGQIKPSWDPYAPESIRYFSDLGESALGEAAILVSNGLSGFGIEMSPEDMVYSIEQLVGGAGRFVGDSITTIKDISKQEEIKPDELPLLSRFYREREEEEVGQATSEYETLKSILQEQSRDRFNLKVRAEKTYKQLKNMDTQEAESRFNTLIQSDPELAKAINKIIEEEEINLTYTQRQMKLLGVRNGERAKYLVDLFERQKSDEERARLWNELTAKKIITKEVANQINKLYEN